MRDCHKVIYTPVRVYPHQDMIHSYQRQLSFDIRSYVRLGVLASSGAVGIVFLKLL